MGRWVGQVGGHGRERGEPVDLRTSAPYDPLHGGGHKLGHDERAECAKVNGPASAMPDRAGRRHPEPETAVLPQPRIGSDGLLELCLVAPGPQGTQQTGIEPAQREERRPPRRRRPTTNPLGGGVGQGTVAEPDSGRSAVP